MAKAHFLIIHGTHDESVCLKNAEHLHLLHPNSELYLIENADHTFGAREPWGNAELPEYLGSATEKCIQFLKEKMVL